MRRPPEDLWSAGSAWLEARLYFAAAYVVTQAVVDRLRPQPAFTPIEDGLMAWDGRWYEGIVDNGYLDAADPAVRFFPLWPLVGRFADVILPGGSDVALVLAANALSLVAGILLYRLVVDETSDRVLARRSVRLLALFPPAFVLVLAYSEALYLTLAIAVLLLSRRSMWWPAAAAGYLAGLTRPVGVLLCLPVGLTAFRERRLRTPGAVTATVAPLLGALTFPLWAEIALGDWSAPIDRQRELRGGVAEPVSRLVRAAWRGLNGDEGELFHFLAAILLITLTVVVAMRLSRPLAVYTIPSALVLVAADNLNSMERYALSAFPIVIAAALVSRHPGFDRWLTTASAAGLLSLATLALNGVYVP